MPHAVAPSASAFAQSTPSASPPDATQGSPGTAATASRSASAVRSPQSANAAAERPTRPSLQPLDERPVRPPRAGDVDRRHAGVVQRPDVGAAEAEADLLDHHRQRREPCHGRSNSREHAAEGGLALRLECLLERIQVDDEAVGARAARPRARRAPARRRRAAAPRRGWRAAAAGARSPADRSGAARGRPGAAAREPSTSPIRCSAAASSSRRLIAPASAVPPVMAEISSGAPRSRPSSVMPSSTDPRSRSGSARWRRRSSSSPVPRRCSTPSADAILRCSDLRSLSAMQDWYERAARSGQGLRARRASGA